MKVNVLTLITLVSLLTSANGFVISVCGSSKNFNLGDNACHNAQLTGDLQWTDNTFTYQSNAKCTMIFYAGENCSGSTYSNNIQNQCHTIPFTPRTMNCAKT